MVQEQWLLASCHVQRGVTLLDAFLVKTKTKTKTIGSYWLAETKRFGGTNPREENEYCLSSFSHFLSDVFSHLYKMVCPSVGPSVGPSVTHELNF